jgi:hypothetical protein
MGLLEKIFLHTKQTISDQELQQIFQASDYDLFHNEVQKLAESGVLVPLKSAKTTKRPSAKVRTSSR